MLNVCKINGRAFLFYTCLKKECGLLNPHKVTDVVAAAVEVEVGLARSVVVDVVFARAEMRVVGDVVSENFVAVVVDSIDADSNGVGDSFDSDRGENGIFHWDDLLSISVYIIT